MLQSLDLHSCNICKCCFLNSTCLLHLEFGLVRARGGGALDGAQEGNLRGDFRDDFILLRLTRLVLPLEILQKRVQIFTSLLHLRVERINFSGERFRGQLLLLLDQLGLFFIAQFDVVGAAGRAEVLAREGVQSIEVTAALVGITERRSRTGEVLERRVTLDAILLAETFLLRAVDVADDDVVIVRERLAELLPRRRERLAVSAPIPSRKNIFTSVIRSSKHRRSRRERARGEQDDSEIQIKINRRSDARPNPSRATPRRAARRTSRSNIARDRTHAPGSVELDEGALTAADQGVEVVRREIGGDRIRGRRERERGDGAEGELGGEHDE